MADIALECGCKAVATHARGDRLMSCAKHHIRYIIRADDRRVTYTPIRLPREPDGPAAA